MDGEVIRSFIKNPGSMVVGSEEWEISQSWLHPRLFLDGDLMKRMEEAKGTKGLIGKCNHEPTLQELKVLTEAFRGSQYQNFLKNLIRAFRSSPYPAMSSGTAETWCGVCGKPLLYWKEWNSACSDYLSGTNEQENKNYLAWGAGTSSVCICLDCLVLLNSFASLLDSMDPGILNYQKSSPGGLKA